MAQVVQAAVLAVALAGGVDQSQVARVTRTRRAGGLAFEEQLLQRHRDVLGKADADKAAGGNGIAVLYQLHGGACAHDLAAAERGDDGVVRHGVLLLRRVCQTMPVR